MCSNQDEDQRSQNRKLGPKSHSAEKEKTGEGWNCEKAGSEEACALPEKWSKLSMPTAGKLREPLPNHGSKCGETVHSDRHSQVGQI